MRLNNKVNNILEFTYADFELENYDPHPLIKAPIAI
jgi:thymidylate synthase